MKELGLSELEIQEIKIYNAKNPKIKIYVHDIAWQIKNIELMSIQGLKELLDDNPFGFEKRLVNQRFSKNETKLIQLKLEI